MAHSNTVPLRSSETGLPRYDAMCTAIAECHRVMQELVLIEEDDKVEALKFWARLAQNLEPERQAAEVRIRGERRLEELFSEMTGRPIPKRNKRRTRR